MAHLLGSKNCIESLSKDVTDLHETIRSVIKKVGRVQHTSWKFPNRPAVDLDIEELLEDYSYCKDEESNQLSHIIMFELVIDRFCLLLQVVSKLFEQQVMSDGKDIRPESKTVTSTMSIGLVSKKFWSRLSQFQYEYNRQGSDLSSCNQSLMDLEDTFTQLQIENDELNKKHGKQSCSDNKQPDRDLKPEEKQVSGEASASSLSLHSAISTQTLETAFVECKTCSKLQSTLIDIGQTVLTICETQCLPSSLNKQNKVLTHCKVSYSIVEKWSTEFTKDLRKVHYCVQESEGENNTLKKQLYEFKTKKENLEKEVFSLTSERDALQKRENELNEKCNNLTGVIKSYEEKNALAQDRINELQVQNEVLKKNLENTTDELGKHKVSIRALEQGMNSLTLQLQSEKTNNKETLIVKQQLNDLEKKYETVQSELRTSSEQLEKLKANNKVLLKHDQGLQVKQTSLLSRLEQLDEKCEELQHELSQVTEAKQHADEENEKLRKRLIEKEEELEKIKNSPTNEHVNSTESASRDKQNLAEVKEKLKLIIAYPVLGVDYGAVEEEYIRSVNDVGNSFTNDEDVAQDMKRQIQANATRITILEDQNTSLRSSLLKLDGPMIDTSKADERNDESRNFSMVNHQNNYDNERAYYNDHRSAKSTPNRLINEEMIMEPRPPTLPRSNVQRPRSGGRGRETSSDIQSRLFELEKLKSENWSSSSSSSSSTSLRQQNEWTENRQQNHSQLSTSFTCTGCGKSHTSQRDLNIHQPFCYGKL